MGLLNFLKKVYTEEYDETEDLEDIAYDREDTGTGVNGGQRLSEDGNAADSQQDKERPQNDEDRRFDHMLDSTQAKGLLEAVENTHAENAAKNSDDGLQAEKDPMSAPEEHIYQIPPGYKLADGDEEYEYIDDDETLDDGEYEYIYEMVDDDGSREEQAGKKKRRADRKKKKKKGRKQDRDAEDYGSHAVKLPDTSRKPRKLEKVNVDIYNRDEAAEFVRSQCEVMQEATAHIETAMAEYSNITEQFADIELLDNAPEQRRKEIAEAAERVDNLTVDRRIFKATESRLSNSAYRRMEMYEEEIPRKYNYLQQQESYYDTVKHDMRMLEGEQMGLRMEARALGRRQRRIRSAAVSSMLCLAAVFSIFVIAIIAMDDSENLNLFLIVTILGAALALGMFALLAMTHRQVLVTEIRLNKAANLLNKTKIKYVNAANALDYAYAKYRVKSSYELGRKYELYQMMKEEQDRIMRMTANLNEAEQELHRLLKNLGMSHVNIWLGQIRALYSPKDMVEVRHELTTQRQKLRSQIEYNENRIAEAKQGIRQVAAKHPDFTDEAVHIIEQYEHQNLPS